MSQPDFSETEIQDYLAGVDVVVLATVSRSGAPLAMPMWFVNDSELACDNQLAEPLHKTCDGWNTFTSEDLARFAEEMLGEEVVVKSPDDTTS